jgi:ligand-binding SRPBCC domain-containing protein
MNLKIRSQVKGNYRDIMAGFDRQLFEALLPKLADVEIVEFTGSKKGDRVHIRFNSPIRTEWISKIVKDEVNDTEAYFIDEGVTLPPLLSYWQHKHIVQKVTEDTSIIIDDISYRSRNPLLSLLIYPAIFFGFYPRKKQYKAYFNGN